MAATVFAFFHEVELKQDVSCEIISSSEIKVQGPEGLVSAVYAHPSDRVERGTPLFQITRDLSLSSDGRQRPIFDEQMRDAQIQAADAEFGERSDALRAQEKAAALTAVTYEAQLHALDDQIAQQRQIASEAGSRLGRLKSLADYVAADRIEQASADVHQANVAVAQAMAARQALQGQIETLRGTQNGLTAQIRELTAQHAREVQDVRMRFEQQRQNVTISAPRAGVVTFSSLIAGRALGAGEVALVIGTEPKQPLVAALKIPSRQRGFVKEGQVVRIKLYAFPYARFGTYEARIDSISATTVGSIDPSSAQPPATGAGENAGYMAWATLRGNTFDFGKERLRILSGMRGKAGIVVERRTIAEWVLAPLFRVIRG